MKKNSKSGLCIKQVIAVILIVIIMSTILPLVTLKNNKLAEVNKANEQAQNEETLQVAQAKERDTEITTRGLEERTVQENKKVEYKTIEQITIAKDMDITKRCGVSKEDFNKLLENLKSDKTGFFETNSSIIYDICEKYELNEIFFCGLIVAESGWNISSSHRNAHNYISMISNEKLIKYESDEEGLEAAAKLLHNQYLTESGSFYNGKTLKGVQKVFCPNSTKWVNLVYNCMEQIVN